MLWTSAHPDGRLSSTQMTAGGARCITRPNRSPAVGLPERDPIDHLLQEDVPVANVDLENGTVGHDRRPGATLDTARR
eukprot:9024635-Alexandrium_andersonii.AAC.1